LRSARRTFSSSQFSSNLSSLSFCSPRDDTASPSLSHSSIHRCRSCQSTLQDILFGFLKYKICFILNSVHL
jgi:hypothetical protein